MALNRLRQRVSETYLVKNVSLLLFASVIGSLIGVARIALLAEHLPKKGFGVISYVVSIQGLVGLLGLPGFSTAIAQYTAKGFRYAWKLSAKRRLGFAALGSLVLVVLALVFLDKTPELGLAFLVGALLLPLMWLSQGVGAYLSGVKRFSELAVYKLLEHLANFLGACAGLFAFGQASGLGVLTGQWLLLNIMSLGFVARHWRELLLPRIPTDDARGAGHTASFSRYAWSMTWLAAASGIQNWLSPILIGTFISLPELADYAIGDVFYNQMKRIWGAYYEVTTPRLLRLSGRDMRKQILREQRYVMLLWTLSCVGLGTASAIFMPVIFSGKYASSLPFIIVLLAASWVGTIGGSPEIYFRLQENDKALRMIRAVSVLSAIVFPAALISFWGALGVAIGRLLSNAVFSTVGWILFVRDGSAG